MGYLIHQKRQSSTIKFYISAIKAVLQAQGIKLNQDQVLISALMRACKIQQDRISTKLPIRKSLMQLLIKALDKVFSDQHYLCTMSQSSYGWRSSIKYTSLIELSPCTTSSMEHCTLCWPITNFTKS